MLGDDAVRFATTQRYVETHSRYEFGMTAHAFCAGLRELVKECVRASACGPCRQ